MVTMVSGWLKACSQNVPVAAISTGLGHKPSWKVEYRGKVTGHAIVWMVWVIRTVIIFQHEYGKCLSFIYMSSKQIRKWKLPLARRMFLAGESSTNGDCPLPRLIAWRVLEWHDVHRIGYPQMDGL